MIALFSGLFATGSLFLFILLASNGGMISEWIGKDLEERGC
jgi:hypothetical protein